MQPTLFTIESTLQGKESPREGKEHENGGFDPFYAPKWKENKGKKAENGSKLLPYGGG